MELEVSKESEEDSQHKFARSLKKFNKYDIRF